MSSKSNLQNQVKNLKNQVAQLKRARSATVNITTSSRRTNRAPAAQVPTWSGSSKPLRIHQSERVGTITTNSSATTPGAFDVVGFVLNPANSTTFPWLSSIAQLFDKYKFHKLRFTYINNAPTSIPGNVSIAVDFDTLDTAPADSAAMSNLAKFKTFAPWKAESLDIPVNRRGNNLWLYTEDAQATANTSVDLKTYNLGKLYVSTEGFSTASTVAGYLMVEYDVELLDKNPN